MSRRLATRVCGPIARQLVVLFGGSPAGASGLQQAGHRMSARPDEDTADRIGGFPAERPLRKSSASSVPRVRIQRSDQRSRTAVSLRHQSPQQVQHWAPLLGCGAGAGSSASSIASNLTWSTSIVGSTHLSRTAATRDLSRKFGSFLGAVRYAADPARGVHAGRRKAALRSGVSQELAARSKPPARRSYHPQRSSRAARRHRARSCGGVARHHGRGGDSPATGQLAARAGMPRHAAPVMLDKTVRSQARSMRACALHARRLRCDSSCEVASPSVGVRNCRRAC